MGKGYLKNPNDAKENIKTKNMEGL